MEGPIRQIPLVDVFAELAEGEWTLIFANRTQQGGDFMILWDDQVASASFRVAG